MTTPRQADGLPAPGRGPRLTVVLPVSGVEEYLGACLDSVLGQPSADLEVIAVDDASADRCGEILDARARDDPRLRVIHLAESGGPGPARNLGLAQATGEYVWFVDPDDLLTAGSLEAVGQALAGTGADVLLIDYRSLQPSGRTEPSPGGSLRRAPDGPGHHGTVTLAQWPALINRTMTSWSKVIRRQFLRDLRVPFPPGIHEDVPVSCAGLLGARRIAVLDRVCYLYRRRRRSLLVTKSMGHFAIFSAYAQVFAAMDDGRPAADPAARPAISEAVREAVFARAMQHYAAILSSGLVPRRARRDFFHRMAADFRHYRPAGYSAPPGVRGMKFRLVEQDAWRRYAILEPLNKARVAGHRALRSRLAGLRDSPVPAAISRQAG
jgi:CDP-glycerol glycerophosphotransferase